MSAGLDASTVTPGNAAPEVSRAEPAIDAWADADEEVEDHYCNKEHAPQTLTHYKASRQGCVFRIAQPGFLRSGVSLYQNGG